MTENAEGVNVVINCLYPVQFHGDVRAQTASYSYSYSEIIRRKVEEKWAKYGFDPL
jgi:hypothetical protein